MKVMGPASRPVCRDRNAHFPVTDDVSLDVYFLNINTVEK